MLTRRSFRPFAEGLPMQLFKLIDDVRLRHDMACIHGQVLLYAMVPPLEVLVDRLHKRQAGRIRRVRALAVQSAGTGTGR